jgi:hypothetical protein
MSTTPKTPRTLGNLTITVEAASDTKTVEPMDDGKAAEGFYDDDEIPAHFVQAMVDITKWRERRQSQLDALVRGAMSVVFNCDLAASPKELRDKLQAFFEPHHESVAEIDN